MTVWYYRKEPSQLKWALFFFSKMIHKGKYNIQHRHIYRKEILKIHHAGSLLFFSWRINKNLKCFNHKVRYTFISAYVKGQFSKTLPMYPKHYSFQSSTHAIHGSPVEFHRQQRNPTRWDSMLPSTASKNRDSRFKTRRSLFKMLKPNDNYKCAI